MQGIVGMPSSQVATPPLINQLNALLAALGIPIPIVSPTDLTPSFLTAILESILGRRIAGLHLDSLDVSRQPKVEQVKMILGILETDIMGMDVGLGDIDPRRLADGELEETAYIAELLCWIGRRVGLLPRRHRQSRAQDSHGSPSLLLDDQGTSQSSPRLPEDMPPASGFAELSTADQIQDLEDGQSEVLSALSLFGDDDVQGSSFAQGHNNKADWSATPTMPARTDSVYSTLSAADVSTPFPAPLCDCDPSAVENLPAEHLHCRRKPRVRKTGPIHYADEEDEIASFERGRSITSIPSFLAASAGTGSSGSSHVPNEDVTWDVHEEYAKTVQLLNERAALLAQLANLE